MPRNFKISHTLEPFHLSKHDSWRNMIHINFQHLFFIPDDPSPQPTLLPSPVHFPGKRVGTTRFMEQIQSLHSQTETRRCLFLLSGGSMVKESWNMKCATIETGNEITTSSIGGETDTLPKLPQMTVLNSFWYKKGSICFSISRLVKLFWKC